MVPTSHGVGGPLKFLYIRRLGLFLGLKFLNFNIFWGFQINEYFFGYGDLWIFSGVTTKLAYI